MFGLDRGHVGFDVYLQCVDVLSDVHLVAVDEEVHVHEVVRTAYA